MGARFHHNAVVSRRPQHLLRRLPAGALLALVLALPVGLVAPAGAQTGPFPCPTVKPYLSITKIGNTPTTSTGLGLPDQATISLDQSLTLKLEVVREQGATRTLTDVTLDPNTTFFTEPQHGQFGRLPEPGIEGAPKNVFFPLASACGKIFTIHVRYKDACSGLTFTDTAIINLRCAQSCAGLAALDECLVKSEILEARLGGTPGSFFAFEAEVLRLLNRERGFLGLPALRWVSFLDATAQNQSNLLNQTPVLSHIGLGGSEAQQRIRDSYQAARPGVVVEVSGEILASGQTSPREVVAAWMASQGHKTVILDRRLTEVGLGLTGGTAGPNGPFRLVWTVDFARPASPTPDNLLVQPPVGATLIDADADFEALRSLLRKAEAAFCAGDLGGFDTNFRAFVDLWVALGLDFASSARRVQECLEAVLNNLGFSPTTSSTYTSRLRFTSTG